LVLNIPYDKIELISGTLSKEYCNRYVFLLYNIINDAYEIYEYDIMVYIFYTAIEHN